MWSNPFSSFGWPNEIPSDGLSHSERLTVAKGNFDLLLIKIKKYPIRSISKVLNATYKFLLTILFIYSLSYVFVRNKKDMLYFLGLISTSYVLTRTIFFSLNGYFETRYLATSIPFMELLVVLCMFEKFKKKVYHSY